MIDLDLIRIDGGTQSRAELNQDTVAEYAEAYRAGASFPPVIVFFDGADRWLADGFHRYFGAKAAGLTKIYEEIIPGTQRDAVLYSLKANATHGLKRSNADKRKAVETLLADAEWATWSDRKVAEVCGVGAPLVGDVRRSICNPITDTPAVRTVERNGKTYEQDTSNIGKGDKAKFKGKPKKVLASKLIDAQIKNASLEKEVKALREQAAAPAASAEEGLVSAEKPGSHPPVPAASTADAEDFDGHDDDYDPLHELELLNREVTKLRALVAAEDHIAEAARWQAAYDVAQRRSDEHLITIASRDKQIKFLARQLERCGKAVGEADTDKIAPTVERMARAGKEKA